MPGSLRCAAGHRRHGPCLLQRLRQGNERTRKKLAQVARCAALGQIVSEEQLQEDRTAVDEAAAAFGLAPVYQEEKVEPLYLWPENVRSWNFFQAVSTQWTVGPGGAIGLSYPGVEVVRDAWGIRRKDWSRLFSELQVMERATLAAWRERKK
ncbi:DUF1799 domain-containing protein [Massilia aerilata]|uniref:DUF1799 domain-containing protein n=1 Tax=Massilia aerilata TaxID=453817 RepID=A0ABW0S469_9BURK